MDIGKDFIVLLPQYLGMVGIGADAFDAEKDRVFQGEDIGIVGGIGFQADVCSLLDQFIQGGCGNKRGRPIEIRFFRRLP